MTRLGEILSLRAANLVTPLASPSELQEAMATVAAGATYAPPDGSEKCCGDVNGSGKQCFMYLSKRKLCAILGPDILPITPSMTCSYEVTGPPLPSDFVPVAMLTPQEVGLTNTYVGATCKRCDRLDGDHSACFWLAQMVVDLLAKKNKKPPAGWWFGIQSDGCCAFWSREKFEEPYKNTL